MKRIYYITIILFAAFTINAQIQIGISIGGIGYHPIEDANSKFYQSKLDKKGKLVGYAGMSIFLTYRMNDYFGVKFQQVINQ